jgi:hypothetical protein
MTLKDDLKDWLIVGISVAITVVTCWMLVDTYRESGASPDVFQRKKDILQLGLGLFAVVTGYFFGRAPAEKTARIAEKKADEQTRKFEEVRAASINAAESALSQMAAPGLMPEMAEAQGADRGGAREALLRHLDYLRAQ